MRNEILPPKTFDFSPLLSDFALRADMLFVIRVAGVYCQNIFWQIFNKHHNNARRRRHRLLATARELINNAIEAQPKSGKGAAFCPKCRQQPCSCPKIGGKSSLLRGFSNSADYTILHMRQADILDAGFICLMRKLEENKTTAEVFGAALKQRHGLGWNFKQFIDAVHILQKQRGFLEHYNERMGKLRAGKKVQIPSEAENAQLFTALGRLILPALSNELLHSIKRAKHPERLGASAAAEHILDCAKQWRKQSIRKMFAEARSGRAEGTRKTFGKTAPPRTVPKAQRKSFLTEYWFKIYQVLELEKTGFRPYSFKFHYDFIGKKWFSEIFKILGEPIITEKGKISYEDKARRLNFTHNIVPFYLVVAHLTKILHFYCEVLKAKKGDMPTKQLRAIRNCIAHNGLFWQVKECGGGDFMSVRAVFAAFLNALPKEQAGIFCDRVESLLRRGNYPIAHGEAGSVPKTEKLRRFNKAARQQLAAEGAVLDKRQKVRRVLAGFMRDLQKAGKNSKHCLQKAGKNAL